MRERRLTAMYNAVQDCYYIPVPMACCTLLVDLVGVPGKSYTYNKVCSYYVFNPLIDVPAMIFSG